MEQLSVSQLAFLKEAAKSYHKALPDSPAEEYLEKRVHVGIRGRSSPWT